MKLSKTFTLCFLSLAMAGSMAIAISSTNGSIVKADLSYTLNLDSSNKVTSAGDKVAYSTTGGATTFTYSDVTGTTSGHVTLSSGGSVVNKTAILSITKMNVNFSGNLKAQTSYDANTWSQKFDVESGVTYDLGSNPYYVKFEAATGSVTINSLTFNYSCQVNPNVPTGGGTYTLVTDPADITVGSTVIFTDPDVEVGMSKEQGNNNRPGVEIVANSDGTQLVSYSDAQEFLVGEGTVANSFSFYDGDGSTIGYLYACSSNSNQLKTESSLSANSSWIVSGGGTGTMTPVAQGSYTRKYMQYNNSNSLFSCYDSAKMKNVKIFMKGSGSATAPVDEVGFVATDSGASNYKSTDTFASANHLSVQAYSSDGSYATIPSDKYSYTIKNSSNVTIDPSQPFGEGGNYTLSVTYKNYNPQNIVLTVSSSTVNPITDIALDDVTGSFKVTDKFSTWLSDNGDSWGGIIEYADEDMNLFTYSELSDYGLELKLLNPSGITHDIDTVFGTQGTWTVKVLCTSNPTVYDEKQITVEIIPVQTITLDKSSASITVGGTVQLQVASITPNNATDKTVKWSSTNSSVASVNSNGLVTGLAAGSTTIKATATDKNLVYGSCEVTVTAATSDFVTYTFTSKSWGANPANWSSGKDGNDYINGGVQVTTGSTGANGTSPVSYNNVSKVVIGYCTNASKGVGTIKVEIGSTIVDTTSVSTSGGTTARPMEFVCASPLSGKVKITVSCSTNSIYICYCEIYSGSAVYPTDISLSSSNTSIGVGQTTTVDVGYTPSDTSVKNLTWSSSNSSVATVNNGTVTGVSAGTTTITCTAQGEGSTTITKTIQITVSNISVSSVSVSPTTKTLVVGETQQLVSTILPANATNKAVTYTSNNTSVASVSSSGLVTAVAQGSATITVTTSDGNKTATCSVTVNPAPAVSKTHMAYNYNYYQNHHYFYLDACPLTPNPKLLIIPVWFTDSSSYITSQYKESVRQDIGKAYLGTNSETGWRSVKTYYEELSNNTVSLTGTLTDWYNCGISSTQCDSDNTNAMVDSATNWYFSNHQTDSRTNYDTDGNGYLDGIILIYAAPDKQKKKGNDNLWAYCFWLQESSHKNYSNPGTNVFFWASYDFMYGTTAKSRTGTSYGNGDTSHCTIDAHTFIHEMGHVLGIEDYYDYSNAYNPAGGFSMQDYNVGSHDPYSVMAWGWADPYIPTSTTTIELHSFQSSRELILLTPSWNSYNSPFDEYLLLELYTPTGLNKFDADYQYDTSYPRGPSSTGIRLWHVDSRLFRSSSKLGTFSGTTYTNVGSSGYYLLACSNTYATRDSGGSDHPNNTSVNSDWYYFNILQLIKNKTTAGYTETDDIANSDLFGNGSSFNMSTYGSQFRKTGKLNSGTSLGWSFSVSITGTGDSAVARVTCTKA